MATKHRCRYTCREREEAELECARHIAFSGARLCRAITLVLANHATITRDSNASAVGVRLVEKTPLRRTAAPAPATSKYTGAPPSVADETRILLASSPRAQAIALSCGTAGRRAGVIATKSPSDSPASANIVEGVTPRFLSSALSMNREKTINCPDVSSVTVAGTQLPRDVDGLWSGQYPDPRLQRFERFAIDILHREVVPRLGLADVVHTTHIWMGDAACQTHFPDEPPDARAFVCREQLEGNRLPELQIVGTVHLAHASAAEASDDAVARREDAPGRKPRAVDLLSARNADREFGFGTLLCSGCRQIVGRLRADLVYPQAAVRTTERPGLSNCA
jgi:hypothetical protein